MIRPTMLAVALLVTPALVLAAQPVRVAPQAQQHDTTKAKSSKHSTKSSSSKKSSHNAPKTAPKTATAKDSGSAK